MTLSDDASASHQRASPESLLAAIVESSDDAIIGKDLNGTVTSWNSGAERVFGYTADEMIGQPISRLAPPEHIDEMPAILARIKRGERVDHFETVRLTKDGRRLNISLTVSPIRDAAGKIVGASKIARNITERKLAEEVLTKQAERLLRANADLQQFAYIISHDLQEPLRTILSCTEVFLKGSGHKLDDDERHWLDFSVAAARRMVTMIQGLLPYAQAANEELPMERVATSGVLEWVVKDLRISIESSGAQILYDPNQLPSVHANKIALIQLFQNLLGNALKYRTAEPPHIGVTAERRNENWVFAVRDNGVGIPPQYHERIFVLFQRLYTREFPGSGIGLALCRKIVEKHGGEIWVESEAGNGATFKFTLPAKEA